MRHDQPEPGKFEGNGSRRLAKALYALAGDGLSTALGDVQDFGWYGLILRRAHGYIVHEDSQGFFDYTLFDTVDEAQQVWAELEAKYQEFCQVQEAEA